MRKLKPQPGGFPTEALRSGLSWDLNPSLADCKDHALSTLVHFPCSSLCPFIVIWKTAGWGGGMLPMAPQKPHWGPGPGSDLTHPLLELTEFTAWREHYGRPHSTNAAEPCFSWYKGFLLNIFKTSLFSHLMPRNPLPSFSAVVLQWDLPFQMLSYLRSKIVSHSLFKKLYVVESCQPKGTKFQLCKMNKFWRSTLQHRAELTILYCILQILLRGYMVC